MKTWILAAIFASLTPLAAGEGMWLPSQLPELRDELKSAGLQLDPTSLSRLTEHPMAAVISLGGCTASFVSPRGLVVTNHHCVYGSLQYNSSEERNLLLDGFSARKAEDELPATPGTRVFVTVDVSDVTAEIDAAVGDIEDGGERYRAIDDARKKSVAECEKEPGHRCDVYSFYGGLQYQLIKRMELRDVRLVYAPPGSIGRFGGDVDNWMWPRHTGDFSFYRAYVGPDGKPADYAETNVPYRPRHHLELDPSGLAADDFAMVIGYPGRTHRYRLASEVENRFTWYYPTRRRLYDDALAVIQGIADRRPEIGIKYAGLIGGMNNSTKNYQGMVDGYGRSDMLSRKQKLETDLQAWVERSEISRSRHGSSIERLREAVARQRATQERDMLLEMLGRGDMMSTARRLYRLSKERGKPDAERETGYQERDMRFFKQRLQRLDRRHDPEVDRAVWRHFIEQYAALPADQHVAAFDAFLGLHKKPAKLGDRLEAMYAATKLGNGDQRLRLMQADAAQIEASKDPFLRLAVALYDDDLAREREEKSLRGELQELRPQYMQALLEFLKSQGRTVYDDANGTLRVTFGQVKGYSPHDGVLYLPFTRAEGIRAKFTGEEPFDSPAKQLAAIDGRRYGSYRHDPIDSLPVNFLSTVDTTGGNSGSPTLNGRGELVGLLFDGTYDSINADWNFDEKTTRSIHVDVRYMLWVMEQVDDARYLMDEMGL